MTTEEIEQMISKKGAVVKTSFYSFLTTYIEVLDEGYFPDGFDEETVAIVSYNATLILMEKIRDNPIAFEKRCHVTERNRKRMLKDMETMTFLSYPNGSINHDFEKEIINSLLIRTGIILDKNNTK